MQTSDGISGGRAFVRGITAILSIPAFILTAISAGFGVFAREIGLGFGHTIFMSATIWAMPGQIVMAGSILGGASILATAVAVSLTAIRFAPMTAAWTPYFPRESTPRWQILLLSHVVVVTSWVVAAIRLPDMHPRTRFPFFAGFALTLFVVSNSVCALSYLLASSMPAIIAGALFFLTPVYFLCGMTVASRLTAEKFALAGGLVVGPMLHWTGVPLDLLWTGFVTGTAAYVVARAARSRR